MAFQEAFRAAAAAIRAARALVVTAGAGMGVDSGLPDFRGDQGFWNAYPMYQRLGINFVGAANPEHFERDPAFGWGFYGHRTNLYRATVPHAGFGLLREWAERFDLDTFVVTSNVDGQFQKAGFREDQILEVHGSIHHLQCLTPCSHAIWDNREEIPVDLETMRAGRIPVCPRCGGAARPNILMFGDWSWISDRTAGQERKFDEFVTDHRASALVVVELGAGTAIPTIRHTSEQLGQRCGATVIRINPREAQAASTHISLPCGALEGLRGIAAALDAKQLQRFKNEAQAAALLHHTSIVPVYAIGCERGVHYYAMQFIHGQSLDDVLHELRRLRGPEGTSPVGAFPTTTSAGSSAVGCPVEHSDAATAVAGVPPSATWVAPCSRALSTTLLAEIPGIGGSPAA